MSSESWKPKGMDKGDPLLEALHKAHGSQTPNVEADTLAPKKTRGRGKPRSSQALGDLETLVTRGDLVRRVLSDERISGREMPRASSTPSVRTQKTRRKSTEVRRGVQESIQASMSGEQALALSEQISARISTETFSSIARSLTISPSLVGKLARLGNLSDEVREMVRSDRLRYLPASLVARYPWGVQAVLANGLLGGFVTGGDIDYGGIARGGGTLRERFISAGLEWPAGLDPEGNPPTK